MIDLTIDEQALERTVKRARQRRILIPTFAQMRDPQTIPEEIQQRLRTIGLWDLHPLNLFRITWKNDIKTGLYGKVNFLEFPSALSGVKCRIIGLIGKYFPTGSHKVGAAFGCLVPRLVTGQFDPTTQKAVWPSTGNYCRGGAFDSALLGCSAVAILPEEMSRERFEWLHEIDAEIIATPGSESNVKEIYDKCWEIRRTRPDCVIFNQFEEFGNAIWHYTVTGSTVEELFTRIKGDEGRFAGFVAATGSAGTLGAGDYLKRCYPYSKIIAVEALQCPTLLYNGFGSHRIEGIGDKHIPWIHNVRNTDMIIGIDDEACMRVLRLFNEQAGQRFLIGSGISEAIVADLSLLGISAISNLLAAIKTAKYYELDENDILAIPLTDSAEMYCSRLEKLTETAGHYSETEANCDCNRYLQGVGIDYMQELGYYDRKALHNLKYFTWVEQQGKSVNELNELWNPRFWNDLYTQVKEWDELIERFNERVGLSIE
ncbi:pyridoxal-phosphate dependent enzyme [Candidatus Bipolaricaulota bacterium]|nr:pyridoxal-phosphate dependent enzyme [Candidatus Bipolaricaulota bacterium]HBR10473.1 pyridoxal-5-phosphate-dependent protein subunit beta [Candidatus Acetothermia bacterium]